jgi:hypothetical protein
MDQVLGNGFIQENLDSNFKKTWAKHFWKLGLKFQENLGQIFLETWTKISRKLGPNISGNLD